MEFRIVNRASGREFSARPGESVLDAGMRHRVYLPYGCRQGSCGHCKGRLVAGEVHYPAGAPVLSEQEREAGIALLCQAEPAGDITIDVPELDPMVLPPARRLPCKVMKLQRLCHDVMGVWLKLPDAQRPPFLAGQYLDILQDDGTRRSFSIANAPHDDRFLELHIRQVEGGEFTDYIFEDLRERDILRIEMPLGSFFLREDSPRPMILMGGGTGFAPLKGIIEHALHIQHAAPMHLFWGVRDQRDLYLGELPHQWAGTAAHFQYSPVLSEPAQDPAWHGATGWVHDAVVAAYPDLSAYDVYMSGPPVMIDAARTAFVAHGLPEARMFSDAFEYNRSLETAAAAARQAAAP